ncbi:proline-rich receptor-like protein kinase PERK9 [Iris pallida]|uniref:Proline-rich receptor-like protein kinase PERK9 n=1 Tax=Iris pallida TaxID=29817 RepID=A0AAX6EP60_IRIPA|nr:proline-rich receptor-like protein kinase PERK9 [Iris pallida]
MAVEEGRSCYGRDKDRNHLGGGGCLYFLGMGVGNFRFWDRVSIYRMGREILRAHCICNRN